MRVAALAAALLALAGASIAQAQTHEPRTTPAEAFDGPIAAALASPARPLNQRLRDQTRTPAPIMALMMLEPGDRVLDVGSSGGYLALIASALVGGDGHVDIHNTPGWIAQFPSMDPDAMAQQITRENIGYVTAPWDQLTVEPESYDAIVMGQVFHDAVLEAANIEAMNQSLYDMLKPGGRLVIEDHAADSSMPLGQQVGLHRIDIKLVIDGMERAGFIETATILLPSEHDDLRFNVFRPGIRGRTSRYIVAFRKPG